MTSKQLFEKDTSVKLRYPQPWVLKNVARILVPIQMLASLPQMTFAQATESKPATADVDGKESQKRVNRQVPRVAPPPMLPEFSKEPTDLEFLRARVFDEPLVPIGSGSVSSAESRDLAEALTRFVGREVGDDTSAVEAFLMKYPESRWRASLQAGLGVVYRRTGYFSKALVAWQDVWERAKGETGAGQAVADRAVSELAALRSRLGRTGELQALLAEVEGRNVRGSAAERLDASREALWLMQNRPESSFKCGPLGLDRILAATRPGYVTDPRIDATPSTKDGTSLAQMESLANSVGLDFKMAKREDRDVPFPTPALVHWNAGHFAALVRREGERYLVQDPTFGTELWVTTRALREEASGYALVSKTTKRPGWRWIEPGEGDQVWGKGVAGGANQASNTTPEAPNLGPGGSCRGMAGWSVHAMLVSLNIKDTPLGYSPAVGPAVDFTITYNQREAFQPQTFYYSNLGPKWTFDWLSYIEDDPANAAAPVNVFRRGGGADIASSFDSGTSSYAADYRHHAVIVRTSTSPIRYERRTPDGSVEVFAQPDGAGTFPRRVFMTEAKDPQGNTVTYTYDASLRVVAVTDAVGQVTTLSYDLASDPLKITKVTDPFGRFATLDYNDQGQLIRITDVTGIQSEFAYQTSDFVSRLTTPYGATYFSLGAPTGLERWLDITNPLGGRERVRFFNNHYPAIPAVEPANLVPTGFGAYNNWQVGQLDQANTVYWDAYAMEKGPGDVNAARIIHWLWEGTLPAMVSGIVHSEKRPLENRVWYMYAGSNGYQAGPSADPIAVGRVLDDGTSQITSYEYNAAGMRIKEIDPVGRETVYVYGTNNVPDPVPATGTGIDLLQIKRKNGASYDIVTSYNYDSEHRPLTVTDGAGQVTTYTYTAEGQVQTVTTPPRAGITEDRTTINTYDPLTGNLLTVTSPGNATTTYTYDTENRLRTATDVDGYTLTYDYDQLDRPTRTTYPDGTYEETQYEGLDPVRRRDRLGRWSHTFYDGLRRVVSTRDPEGRVVTQEWCNCGSLGKLTDPNGNATSWERDTQGRVIKETRANNSFKTFEYDTTGRLKKVVDAKLQEVQYTYGGDDKLLTTTYVNAEHPTPNVTFSYTDPSTSAPDAHGRVRSMLDGTGTTIYGYHPFGILGAGQAASVDGPLSNDVISYTYDELGRVVSRTLNGVTTTWAYDARGRLTTLGDPIGNFTYSYVGSTGRVSSMAYPNGQTTSYAYLPVNQDLRLQEIHHKKSGGVTLNKFNYTYDALGNILTWAQQTDTNPAQTYTLEYDRADQLTAATLAAAAPKRYRYAYDPAGNRTLEQIDDAATLATHDNMNRLTTQVPGGGLVFRGTVNEPATVTVAGKPATVTSANQFTGTAPVGQGTTQVEVKATDPNGNVRTNLYEVTQTGATKAFVYDANGNLCAENGTSCTDVNATKRYEWDAINRLTAVKQGVTTLASFTHDGNGRRATKTASGVATSYLYDGNNFLEERPGAGTTKRYVYGPGIDRLLALVVGGTTTYSVADHIGSVNRSTDGLGNPTLTREYDPWGNPIQGSAISGYSFTGREWDSEAGLYYYRARYYDPAAARFIGEDPLGQNAGPNLYRYVDNNPIQFTDPLGLAKVCYRQPKGFPATCHCFIVLCDGTTLGAYRFGIILDARKNYKDDKPIPKHSVCWDLGLSKDEEDKLERRYDQLSNDYPKLYGLQGTSNTIVGDTLALFNRYLPPCALGGAPLD